VHPTTAARLLKRYLGQPALVRASTMSTFPLGLLTAALRKRTAPALAFTDVVLEDRLMQRMTAIATATANATKRRAPFRNLLLHGTPGTGKTMVAERLAKAVGLDYAVMSGGDVVPLGKNAVPELHALFDWARASPHGVLLLIDEADAFLRHRDSPGMSEYMRSALNAVLARTGTQSYKIMLVLVTNRPDDLDEAVLDRMDDVVEFALPEAAQRTEMLQLYLRSYLPQAAELRRGQSAALAVEHKGLTSEVWAKLVKVTHGFSGREMAKLMAAVQAVVYGRDGELVMTAEDLVTMALQKQREHDSKANGFGPSVRSRTNPAFESR
jgi:ATPase family AAA domain-containing protein 3A/B